MIPQIHLDRHLFIQQISALMPGTVLDSGDVGINKTEKKVPVLLKFTFL